MTVGLTKTVDGSPVGALSAYTVTTAAMPISPADNSGQLPTFSTTIADRRLAVGTLPGTNLTLEDWTGLQTSGDVKSVKRSPDSGLVNLDMSSVLDKVNTNQSTLPIILTDDTGDPRGQAISHWITTCGVLPTRLDNTNVLSYLGQSDPYGYIKNSFARFTATGTAGGFTTYGMTTTEQPVVTQVNSAQGLVFGMRVSPSAVSSGYATEGHFRFDLGTNKTVSMKLKGATYSGSNLWMLSEEVDATDGSSTGSDVDLVDMLIATPGASDIYVFARVLANAADATKVDITLRIIYWDAVNKVPVVTDAFAAGMTSTLRNTPTISGMKLWTNPIATAPVEMYMTDATVFQSSYPTPVFKAAFSASPPAGTVAYKVPGFTGNVWQNLAAYCAIVEADMDALVDSVTGATYYNFTDRSATDTPLPVSGLMETIETRNTARSVEVVLREVLGTDTTFNNNLLWKATSVYSLNQGEYREEIVQTTASFVSLAQPVCVTGVPVPYTSAFGSYVITGNDGFIVDPQWWADNGGSIKVAPTGKSGEVKIKLQAPAVTTTRAPYRVSEGVADRPALYLFGKGINLSTPTTLTMYTGADSTQVVGVTFDSPFITRKLLAHNTGYKLAKEYGTANTSVTFRVPRGSATPSVGTQTKSPLADTIMWHGANYRISQQSVDASGIGVTKADMFTTIRALNAEFCTGRTTADWRTLHAGQMIKEANLAPMPKSER